MLALALAAWTGALVGFQVRGRWLAPLLVLGVLLVLGLWRRAGRAALLTGVAALLVFLGVVTAAGVRVERISHNPLARLAAEGAVVTLSGSVATDPRVIHGQFGDKTLVRVDVRRVTGRGASYTLREPVLVIGQPSWQQARIGSTVDVEGRLGTSDDHDVAAVVSARGDPETRAPPDIWWRASARVRQALRDSVADLPADRRALVPALVDGDDAGLDEALADDFRTTGLTHLLAVSGTNLTLVVGFVLVVARWAGARGRWLYAVGALGIVGFVLLARAEPSVLRAAAMGTVSLLGMGTNGRQRGTRALGVAVVSLLLIDPSLAPSIGFALSVLATAGILLIAPSWRDALAHWLPRWLAEAVAVPAAAQLACTPLIAVISGHVSLVAVVANLLAAPAVGPATVLGLIGGLLGLVWLPLGSLAGTASGWCVAWIITVARHGAVLPTAAVGWGSGPVAVTLLTVLTATIALVGPRLIRRRTTGVACCVVMVATVLVRLPTPGWPPDDWVMVACDVGQGDGLVLNSGQPHTAVVVDAGPDPRAMDECLRRLAVTRIPLVVLTHFHADHVDGLAGVVSGRQVGALEVTRLADPPDGVALVRRVAASAGLTPSPPPYGVTRSIGDIFLEAVWPSPGSPTIGPGDGSTANNASVVLLARIRGVTLFLGGDIEPEGQAQLARMLPGLRVDVLKVPHHGSRYQDLPFLTGLTARLAVVSVGVDNDYGHPAQSTLAPLAATGARVLRTDLDGDVAVLVRGGALSWATRR